MGCSLNICEIYETLMGESVAAGWPCTIIRMGGCNLNCTYCDTPYARHEYRLISLEKILEKVRHPYPHHVLVTGGEPLIQPGTPKLILALLEQGHKVYIETNGSLDIRSLDKRVLKVMDIKCPSSGESKRNIFQNVRHLTPQDEIKFVICDKTDFRWAKKILKRYEIQKYAPVLFSPAAPHLDPKLLAKWILEEEVEVRFQLQLHKMLWGERRGI